MGICWQTGVWFGLLKKIRIKIHLWLLQLKAKKLMNAWNEYVRAYKNFIEEYNIYLNWLYKLGYIKDEDIRRWAEAEAEKDLKKLKPPSYIG